MIASPCVNVCKMQGDICRGCLRTLDEIARWGNASNTEKQDILTAVAQRKHSVSARPSNSAAI